MSEIPSSLSLSILSRRARFARPSLDLFVLPGILTDSISCKLSDSSGLFLFDQRAFSVRVVPVVF